MAGFIAQFSPVLLIAFGFAEFSAYCAARRFFRLQLLTGVVVLVLLVILQYATEPTSYAKQARPIAYFLVIGWTTAVPLAVLSVGAYLAAKFEMAVWRHVCLAVLASAVMVSLPMFALWSVCTSGVDCV